MKHTAIQPTTSTVTLANRWDHFLARWGVNRSGHRVEPGLYALGNPTADSPVFHRQLHAQLRRAAIGAGWY